jgi:hypothetical protein
MYVTIIHVNYLLLLLLLLKINSIFAFFFNLYIVLFFHLSCFLPKACVDGTSLSPRLSVENFVISCYAKYKTATRKISYFSRKLTKAHFVGCTYI